MSRFSWVAIGTMTLCFGVTVLADEASTPPGKAYRSTVPPQERQAFFGDLHLHTVMSLDAWTFGTKITPDQAYKFARGETVMVPTSQLQREEGVDTNDGVPAKRAWPLDFTAVTDHSEYLGAMHQLDNPESDFAKGEIGKEILASPGNFYVRRRGGGANRG